MDAATLMRDELKENNNLTRGRTKTGTDAFVPLPAAVAGMLRTLPNDHADYFFWNPDRMRKTSIVCIFGDWLPMAFDRAKVPHGREKRVPNPRQAGSTLGSVLHAAEVNENRTLDGQRVPVVLFKIGTDGKGWYWLPRGDFYRCTEKYNPGTTTSVPFPILL
jgi:hypothetical protein